MDSNRSFLFREGCVSQLGTGFLNIEDICEVGEIFGSGPGITYVGVLTPIVSECE